MATDKFKTQADQVYFAFRSAQNNFLSSGTREVGYHVTDLCKPCMRNVFYTKRQVKGSSSLYGDTLSVLYCGNAIHAASDLKGELHEFKMFYDIKNNVSLDKAEFDKLSDENKWNVVVGTCDDVVKTADGEYTVVDKKTWLSKGYKKTSPSEDHVSQVNIYKLMLQKSVGITAKYGCILYLDLEDRIAKPQPMAFELNDLNEITADVVNNWTILEQARKNKQVPPRVRNWMCDAYCPHLTACLEQGEKLEINI